MKKLLCLVFVLIALLGLTFAVSAADAEKLTGLADVSKFYKSDDSLVDNGGMNGGSYISHLFDGGYGACYNNNVGSYIITDLNAKLPGGYYVSEIKIYHSNNSKFSLYYTSDGVTWIPLVENAQVTEATYAVGKTVTQVKFVFETCANWTASVKEIEIYGIDPSTISCEHNKLTADGWKPVPGSATCTEVGKVAQKCPDCGEEIQQVSNDVLPLGHDIVTTVTRPGTSVSYGAATLKCSRCEYSIDFSGEVNLTDGTYSSIRESEQFVNILVSSIADLWGASKIENLFTGDWVEIGPFHTWVAAGEDDSLEYVMLDFKGEIDLTRLSVLVQNDSGGYLVLSALNSETGEYEEVRRLQTYDESIAGGAALRMDVPLLGVTTSALKIQVFSNWRNANGYYYNRMVIGELEAFGIAKGCGLDASNHECVFDIFVDYVEGNVPTCQESGRAVFKCLCNATTTVEVAASEEYHSYVEVEGTRVDATCTTVGSYTGKCEYCEAEATIEVAVDTENGHDFSEEVSRKDADCENAGEIVYGCANCDATKTEEIAAIGHKYTETARTEPDCENPGSITYVCDNCSAEKVEEIAANGHAWELVDIYTEPTCGEEGEGAYECTVCGDTKDDVIDATGEHTWDEENVEITINPSCTGTGTGRYTCTECGATKLGAVPALGHTFVAVEGGEYVAPTCKQEGSEERICSVCGAGGVQKIPVDPDNHDFQPGSTEQDGSVKYTCSYGCGNSYVVNNSAVNGEYFLGTDSVVFADGIVTANGNEYTYEYNVTSGMITTDDETVYFQVIDGVIYFKGAEQLHQHNEETEYIVETTDATCTENGIAVTICPFGCVISEETIEAVGHQYTYACDKVCNVCYEETNPEATHTIVHVDAVAATCTENGNVEYWYCSDCGTAWADEALTQQTNLKNVVVPAAGHQYFYPCDPACMVCYEITNPDATHNVVHAEAKAATCTENGNVEYWYCADCGTAWADEALTQQTNVRNVVIPAAGHQYTYACDKVCNVCYEITNEEATHTIVHVDAVDATCTENGNVEYWYCSDCGTAWANAEFTQQTNLMNVVVPAAGHQYFYPCDPVCMVCYEITNPDATHNIVHVDAVDATCTENGNVEYWYCSICGTAWADAEFTQQTNLMNVVVPAGHVQAWDFSDEEAGYVGAYEWVNATCIAEGYLKDKCAGCGEVLIFETFPIDTEYGHVEVEGTRVEVEANCKDAGSFSYECAVCGETITGEIEVDPWAHTYDNGAVVDGKLVYTCIVCGGTEEKDIVELVVGDNTINFTYVEGMWGGSYEAPYVIITTPGKYTITSTEASFDLYGGRGNFTWIEELPYEFEVAEGESVIFVLSGTLDWDQASAVVTLAEAEAGCNHVEEVIPAVRPTPSVEGYTAGVKCAECGEILVAPVAINITEMLNDKSVNTVFRVAALSLSAQENISVNYKLLVTEGYNNPYVVFQFDGYEYLVDTYTIEASSGRYVFNFAETRPQLMATNICANLYAETAEGEYTLVKYETYSVLQYILGQLKKNDPALTTVMSDILVMGAKTQLYMGVNTDALVTDLAEAEGYTLTPSTFTGIDPSLNQQAVTGDRTTGTDWKAISLAFGASTEIVFKFETDNVEGLKVKVSVAGNETYYDASELTMDGNRYVVYFPGVRSYEYNETVTATFERDGVQVGSTFVYSINTFLTKNYESAKYDENAKELMKAIYTYGDSIYKYFA